MREQLQEILVTISRNKLRTFLTGFSVAWGIFMLIILLGSGNGLKNGVMSNFADRSINSMFVYGGRTSQAYGGYQNNRAITPKTEDLEALKSGIPNITEVSGRFSINNKQISYGKEFSNTRLEGVAPLHAKIDGVKIQEGRFINQRDIDEVRKVVVLEQNCVEIISPKRSIVGKDVKIDGILFKVIGVYKGWNRGNYSQTFAPISTVQELYVRDNSLHTITFTVEGVKNKEQNEAVENQVRSVMGAQHTFNPKDNSALWINSRIMGYMQTMNIFNSIDLFIWIIGLGTLLAGVVGVSNIMLVTVRERTTEFGIRKSMGASPASLVKLVLMESIMITAFFGYIGMILGIGIMELVNLFLERHMAANPDQMFVIFLNPTLNLSVIFSATIVLVIAGMIAGYIPAKRAAKLKTIDAMRYNK